MQGYLIIGLIFALLIAVFSIQNAGPVSLSFFNWQFDTSLVVVILGAAALGALAVGIVSYIKQFRLKRKLNRLKNSNKELERANQDLSKQLARIHENNKDNNENNFENEENAREE